MFPSLLLLLFYDVSVSFIALLFVSLLSACFRLFNHLSPLLQVNAIVDKIEHSKDMKMDEAAMVACCQVLGLDALLAQTPLESVSLCGFMHKKRMRGRERERERGYAMKGMVACCQALNLDALLAQTQLESVSLRSFYA